MPIGFNLTMSFVRLLTLHAVICVSRRFLPSRGYAYRAPTVARTGETFTHETKAVLWS